MHVSIHIHTHTYTISDREGIAHMNQLKTTCMLLNVHEVCSAIDSDEVCSAIDSDEVCSTIDSDEVCSAIDSVLYSVHILTCTDHVQCTDRYKTIIVSISRFHLGGWGANAPP